MLIYDYQQGNHFAITMRGHLRKIPSTTDALDNYSILYDSCYSPTDFKIKSVTIRSAIRFPEGGDIQVKLIVNGGALELFPIPYGENDNIKTYSSGCDLTIWEDDKIEVEVIFSGDYSKLLWNDHNIVVSLDGAHFYEGYVGSLFEGEPDPAEQSSEYDDEEMYDNMYSWTEGANWYKTAVRLQNRSGYDLLKNQVIMDTVKSPTTFLIQGVSVSIFNDKLTTLGLLDSPETCFYIDIFANGNSILSTLGASSPISLKSTGDTKVLELAYNTVSGYSVKTGDDLSFKILLKNVRAKYNGKIIQCHLYGSCMDMATENPTQIAVYEPCETAEPCTMKYEISTACDVDIEDVLTTDEGIRIASPIA
jgi:hypothetical protein